ncbi:Fur family transcriptional regulator [Lujinxingia litoralis]|uniref:Fur family transcriptional regulator n=1 Tax=Lujinxingia litoralis TaxID=2211119 RepID=A0A328CAR2_9DELT|nr:transcriptional repressor [Lujinxingia litoralis]RAL24746.1 Fur family transcriptional regulator [Lujinxingia litoralis]
MAAPHEYSDDALQAMIREAGLRCTTSRTTVLARLVRATAPLSHADLAEELVPQGFDQATIYRNLTDLTEAGLLNRLDLGDHIWRFEFRGNHKHDEGEHPHFLCVDCGEVSCLAEVEIKVNRQDTSPVLVAEISEVFLKGLCSKCG